METTRPPDLDELNNAFGMGFPICTSRLQLGCGGSMKHLRSSKLLHTTNASSDYTYLIVCHQLRCSKDFVGMNSLAVPNREIHFLQSGAIKLDCLLAHSLIVMTYADAGQTEGKQSWSQGSIF